LNPLRYEDDEGEVINKGEGDGDGNGNGDGKDGEGEGSGKGNGQGTGEGDGEGDGDGSGTGSGGGVGQTAGAGGNLSGNARGKSLDELSELPDPSSEDFQSIENPGAAESRERTGDEISEEVQKASREVKREEWAKFLKKLEMTAHDAEKYENYKVAVKTEVRELRVTLEGLEANESERIWLKNQSTGDLDDSKLIDGLTGERSIYKRRSVQSPESMWQAKPKRISVVMDMSMSIVRYSADGRLQRSLEAATMMLEATKGLEHRYDLAMSAHSGDTAHLPLVDFGHPPRNDKQRLDVIKKMHAHAEMCESGDNTIEGIRRAIESITRADADSYYVFALSDANLDQYNIGFETLQKLFNMDPRVHVFVLFIATMGDQAQRFEDKLPGKVFTCLDKSQIPKTLKRMFLAAATTTQS